MDQDLNMPAGNDLDILNSDDNIINNLDDKVVDDAENKEDKEDGEDKEDDLEEDVDEELDELEELEEKEDKKDKKEDGDDDLLAGEITAGALKKAYPDIFKKFPELKARFFQAAQYAEVFGSIDEAKESQEKAQIFDGMVASIQTGDPSDLITAISEDKQADLTTFAKNFLPSLYKKSKDAYAEAIDPIIKRLVVSTFADAAESGDKSLATAAKYLARHIYGTTDIEKLHHDVVNSRKKVEEKNPKEEELNNREQALFKRQLDAADTDMSSRVVKTLTTHLTKLLTGSDYTKDKLAASIVADIDAEIAKDSAFSNQMKTLRRAMIKAGFTEESRKPLVLAYLRRAKPLIPKLIAKAGQTKKEDKAGGETRKNASPQKSDNIIERRGGGSGKVVDGNKSNIDSKNVNWRKTSDRDFLDGKVTLKS